MATGLPRKTEVTVDSVDVTSYVLGWGFDPEMGKEIKKADIVLSKSVYTAVPNLETNPNGLSVVIKRGVSSGDEDTVLQGETRLQGAVGNKLFVTAFDGMYECVERNITKTFNSNVDSEAGKISEMAKTVINDFTSLTADSTSVQDSGTTITLKRFICNKADVLERLQLFAQILAWQLYQNPSTAKIHFEPQGHPSQATPLQVGVNIVERPRWTKDGQRKIKKLEVQGGPIETGRTESFNGDNSTTEFSIAKLPVSIVKVTVDGTEQIGGVEDQAGSDVDYYVDFVAKKITFLSAPASGTNNVVIQYMYLSPITLRGDNPTVSAGRDVTDRRPELLTVSDVENFIAAKLDRFKEDFLSTRLKVTNVKDLEVGQTVKVIDTNENINQNFVVTRISKSYPYRYDEVEVSNSPLEIEEWDVSMEDRVRRIEEKLSQEEDIVIILKQFNRTVMQYGRRYFKVSRKSIAGEKGIYNHPIFGLYGTAKYGTQDDFSFILGHSQAGILGTSVLGSNTSAENLRFMQQGADYYLETFVDDDFKDSTNTTATWGSGSLSFTSGQVGQSSSVDYRHGTITQAKLTVTSSSGTYTLELSADGGTNWETVTNDTLHTFTNTGDDLRWRITEAAASTGTITQVEIDEYH